MKKLFLIHTIIKIVSHNHKLLTPNYILFNLKKMKKMKKTSILALLVIMMSSCTNDPSTSGNVTLKASSFSATGKTSTTARTAASTVVFTEFKINIGKIKFELDEEDDNYNILDPFYDDDVKLVGPFLIDILDPNNTSSK